MKSGETEDVESKVLPSLPHTCKYSRVTLVNLGHTIRMLGGRPFLDVWMRGMSVSIKPSSKMNTKFWEHCLKATLLSLARVDCIGAAWESSDLESAI
jgi:hypothetical protein